MAIGDKRPVVMEADRATANGVATLGADALLAAEQRPKSDGLYMPDGRTIKDAFDEMVSAVSQLPWQNLLDNSVFVDGCLVDQRGWYVVPPNTPYYIPGETTSSGVTSGYTKVEGFLAANNGPFFTIDNTIYATIPGTAVRGYTGAGYGMDRWINTDNGTVIIESGGIRMNGNCTFDQRIPFGMLRPGTVATMSVFIDNEVYSYTQTIADAAWGQFQFGASGFTGRFLSQSNAYGVASVFNNGNSNLVKAVKLELGSTQTLAHQDADGNWQLNELPNYADTLARCQSYRIPYGKYAQWGAVDIQTDYIDFSIYIPVFMKTKPSIEGTSNLQVSGHRDFTYQVAASNGNNLRIRAIKSAHGLTNAYLEADGDIAFVAEL